MPDPAATPDADAGLSVVDTSTVERLHRHLRNQSKDCVMETLGISSNTWTKIKRGKPVRRILVERAIRRVTMSA